MALAAGIIGGAMIAAGGGTSAAAAKVKGTSPNYAYYGGNKDGYAQRTGQFAGGIGSGQQQTNAGTKLQGLGLQYGDQIGQYGEQQVKSAQGVIGSGDASYNSGQSAQTQALWAAQKAMEGHGPSQAAMLAQANNDEMARQRLGMAAGARGGNRAAAMRTAMSANADQELRNNQQLAALRAQEMAAARGEVAAIGQARAQTGLARMGLGYSREDAGIGNQQFQQQQYMDAGARLQALGAQREGAYLGAQTAMDQAQLDADTQIKLAKAQAQQNKRAQLFGLGGTLIGGGASVMGSSSGGGGKGGGGK